MFSTRAITFWAASLSQGLALILVEERTFVWARRSQFVSDRLWESPRLMARRVMDSASWLESFCTLGNEATKGPRRFRAGGLLIYTRTSGPCGSAGKRVAKRDTE